MAEHINPDELALRLPSDEPIDADGLTATVRAKLDAAYEDFVEAMKRPGFDPQTYLLAITGREFLRAGADHLVKRRVQRATMTSAHPKGI